MKEAKKFLSAFAADHKFSASEVETIILQVQVDANDYKDRLVHSLFRLQDGDLAKAATMAETTVLPEKREPFVKPPKKTNEPESDATMAVAKSTGKGPGRPAKTVVTEAIPDVPGDDEQPAPKKGPGRPSKKEAADETPKLRVTKGASVTSHDEEDNAPKKGPGRPKSVAAAPKAKAPAKPAKGPKPPAALGASAPAKKPAGKSAPKKGPGRPARK